METPPNKAGQPPNFGTPLTDSPNVGNTTLVWWKFWADLYIAIQNFVSVLFKTNGIANTVQNILNLVAGQNITLTADDLGDVTIAAGPVLQTNGQPNPLQTLLNLIAGGNITLATTPNGGVIITSASSAPEFETNGVPNALQSLLNLIAGANITLTADGAGGVTIAGSGGAIGGVNAQAGNYTAVAGDDGKIISFAGTATLKLPAAPPSANWKIFVQQTSPSGLMTVNPNGLDLDGAAANLEFQGTQGVYITTDGTNYFSSQGTLQPAAVLQGNSATLAKALLSVIDSGNGNAIYFVVGPGGNGLYGTGNTSGSTAFIENNGVGNAITAKVYTGGQFAIEASAEDATAIYATNNHPYEQTVSALNSGAGAGLIVGPWAQFKYNPVFANLPTAAYNSVNDGAWIYCTDAKNFADDGVAVGSVAVAGGHGSFLGYCNGSWRTLC